MLRIRISVRCEECATIGFGLWQVTAGTIFDDLLATDSFEEAEAYADATSFEKIVKENEMFEEEEEAKRASEAASQPETDSEEGGDHDELSGLISIC
jgi:calreticulin